MAKRAWEKAGNLLCVRLDAIGDVLMTTPAIRALRESHPQRRITLLTSPSGAEVARLIPEIDTTIRYAPPWMKATPPRTDASTEYAMAEILRRMRFDAAVIFTVYSQSPLPAALLCYLADIPLRLAYCHENPYQLLTDWVPDPEPVERIRHEVQRQLDLISAVGCHTVNERIALQVPPDARRRVRRLLLQLDIELHRPWVVIHPGATAPSRCYPADSFAKAAHIIVHELGCQVVFTGSGAECGLVKYIQDAMDAHSHSLAGQLDLPLLAALIALAPVLIVNNTGPAHIAAAVGTPVVDLYALTNLQHTPWAVASRVLFHDVPCKCCYKSVCPEGHHNCLRLVPPEAVAQATAELLDLRGGRTPQHRILAAGPRALPADATDLSESPMRSP